MGLLRLARGRSWKTFALALASLLIAAAVWSINGGRDRTVPPGETFRHDDFAFTVRSSRRMAGTKPSEPSSLAVMLEVENKARRVGYAFQADSALIVDDQSRFYRPVAAPAGPILPAGSRRVESLKFEMPGDARGLRLRLDFGGVGDTLERLLRGWRWVELEPGRPR